MSLQRAYLKHGLGSLDISRAPARGNQECQRQVAAQVPLPPGYRITWEGQFENQQRATARLRVIVPLSLLGVLGLLFFAFRRLRYATLIMLNVPFVLIGAVALLALTHTNLSVSAMTIPKSRARLFGGGVVSSATTGGG